MNPAGRALRGRRGGRGGAGGGGGPPALSPPGGARPPGGAPRRARRAPPGAWGRPAPRGRVRSRLDKVAEHFSFLPRAGANGSKRETRKLRPRARRGGSRKSEVRGQRSVNTACLTDL